MSKKGAWTRSSISGSLEPVNHGGTGSSPPQLFSRRFSKAQPFVIQESDYPYDSKKQQRPSVHRLPSNHHTTGHTKTLSSIAGITATSSLIGLGIYRSTKSTTGVTVKASKRSKRVAVALLLLLGLCYWKFGAGGGGSLPVDPSSGVYRSSKPIKQERAGALRNLFSSSSAKKAKAKRLAEEQRQTSLATSPHGGHTFHPNGLLLVNPQGRHPINVLMDNAQKKWDNLVNRQSKTLDEATQEYKRRYRRNPPKGWESWWVFLLVSSPCKILTKLSSCVFFKQVELRTSKQYSTHR
jgi:hypothetical protein